MSTGALRGVLGHVFPCGSGKRSFMESTVEYPKQDVFYWLKRPTITRIRAVLEWADKHALRTDISFRDDSGVSRRKATDKTFEEVMKRINGKAKPYFRVILRKNQNWFLLLSNKKHIEDLIEIGIRGIEIDSNEYFIHCFLKKELMNQLKRKFQLAEDVRCG